LDSNFYISETLFRKLKETLTKFNLNFDDIVGKSYDGAANMSGGKKGLSTLVLNENIKALYIHCLGHRLNLALLMHLYSSRPILTANSRV
jgi:hypothetical protein